MKLKVGICKDLIENISDDAKHALDQVLERDSASKAKKRSRSGSGGSGGLVGSLTGGLSDLTSGLGGLTGGLGGVTGGLGSLGGLASAGSSVTTMSTVEALAALPGQLAEISRLLSILLSALESEVRPTPMQRIRLAARFLAFRRRLRRARDARAGGAGR